MVDANVLIDYLDAEPELLTAAARHCGRVLVTTPVLEETWGTGCDDSACIDLGLVHYTLSGDQLEEAYASSRGTPLSPADYSCFVAARDERCTCWTNDKNLRKVCKAGGVSVVWGLELMIDLVAARELTTAEALKVARAIARADPTRVTPPIMERFRRRLQEIG